MRLDLNSLRIENTFGIFEYESKAEQAKNLEIKIMEV